jgi:hypothetical protein
MPPPGDQQPAAVRGVDVQPCAGLFAQLGDLGEGIDASEVRGACRGDDGHHDQALALALLHRRGERGRAHLTVLVARYGDDRLRVQTEQRGSLLDAEVAALGGQDAQPRQDLRLSQGCC